MSTPSTNSCPLMSTPSTNSCPPHLHVQIEFPVPDAKTKRRIFSIHTSRMTFQEDVNLEEFVMAKVRVA